MKTLSTLIMSAVFALSLTASTPAKAALFIPALSPVATAGVYTMFGGLLGGVVLDLVGKKDAGRKVNRLAWKMFYPVIGIYILDGEEGQEIAYQALSQEEGLARGLTSEEIASFNSQVDELNAMLSEVTSNLSVLKNPTIEDSAQEWSQFRDYIAPATQSAMLKLAK